MAVRAAPSPRPGGALVSEDMQRSVRVFEQADRKLTGGGLLVSGNSFHRDASGRLAFEIFKVPADSYQAVCRDLMASVRLEPIGNLVSDSLSVVFQDYSRGSQVVGLEWDNWSGFIVVAKTPESESLVQEIADWLLNSKWARSSLHDKSGESPSRPE
jgi:hypothetical protein